MYVGDELAHAIRTAIALKGVNQTEVAREFGIKQQSVSGWTKHGRVSKSHLDKLVEYFSDVVPPSHFGIQNMVLNPERNVEEYVYIMQLDVSASCGGGAVSWQEFPEIVREVAIAREQMDKIFGNRTLEGVYIISTTGDSMVPTIPKNSSIFIDTKQKYFNGDGIYFFFYKGKLYLKRLQQMPDYLLAISDNKCYDKFTIHETDSHELNIIGRYVGILNIQMDW